MIAGILLAAGNSTRMGSDKALLSYNDATFIDTILDNLNRSGCQPIISILGKSAELICKQTSVHKFQCYRNPDPSEGMLSSLKIAVEHLPDECKGFIMALVDHPMVRRETYHLLLAEGKNNSDLIIIPEYQGHHGHPVYFGKDFFSALLKAPNNTGARKVISDHYSQVRYLKVEDSGILIDIDTREDFDKYNH
ncbi:MAG: nucleotidyltransferase family protein [Calditrichaceae bacterium]|nr:nucleotidyltransferase family protein [Calditrichaceae bacterium]MBN2709108.1 nucleotidyltransferase family protein [Calditrichaceae bacterium]RQV92189.1 MAG: nucleotidyltransferase family protein [Calditrichota bacterium]